MRSGQYTAAERRVQTGRLATAETICDSVAGNQYCVASPISRLLPRNRRRRSQLAKDEPEFEMTFENGILKEQQARLPAIIWERGLRVKFPTGPPWQIKPGTTPPP